MSENTESLTSQHSARYKAMMQSWLNSYYDNENLTDSFLALILGQVFEKVIKKSQKISDDLDQNGFKNELLNIGISTLKSTCSGLEIAQSIANKSSPDKQ